MTSGAESKDGAFGLDVRVMCLESRIKGSVELQCCLGCPARSTFWSICHRRTTAGAAPSIACCLAIGRARQEHAKGVQDRDARGERCFTSHARLADARSLAGESVAGATRQGAFPALTMPRIAFTLETAFQGHIGTIGSDPKPGYASGPRIYFTHLRTRCTISDVEIP